MSYKNLNMPCVNCNKQSEDVELTEVRVIESGTIVDLYLCKHCRSTDYPEVNEE